MDAKDPYRPPNAPLGVPAATGFGKRTLLRVALWAVLVDVVAFAAVTAVSVIARVRPDVFGDTALIAQSNLALAANGVLIFSVFLMYVAFLRPVAFRPLVHAAALFASLQVIDLVVLSALHDLAAYTPLRNAVPAAGAVLVTLAWRSRRTLQG